jgi:hypothetical protein
MTIQEANVGEALSDDLFVFRAFSLEGHRRRKKNKATRQAFYRAKDHTDGLYVGMTPSHAVAPLARNFGYCELPVGPVHKLPHDLKICPDLDTEGHALILNIPCIDGTDAEREAAEFLAGRLVEIAKVITCDFFPPQQASELPSSSE